MKNKLYIYLLMSGTLFPVLLCAQSSKFLSHSELGFLAGGIHYNGDLNPKFNILNNLGPGASIVFTRVPKNDRWSWRNIISAGRFSSSDKNSDNPYYRERNLSVRTFVAEVNTQVVFNFFPYEIGGTSDKFLTPMTPYVFFGAGLFYFIPKANYQGTWYNLRNLDTEGQETVSARRKQANGLQASFPFGTGFKISLGNYMGLAIEWGIRKTYTDYLDDVSTTYPDPVLLSLERGNVATALSDPGKAVSDEVLLSKAGRMRGDSRNKDWYSFTGIILTWRINDDRGHCPGY